MRCTTIVGTRPQLLKSVMVTRALMAADIEETLVHTNQHYSPELSQLFLDEFAITPHYNLNIPPSSQCQQTAAVLRDLEPILIQEKPDMVLVYGDCSTTLAAALCACKLKIPVAHVEAGSRQFDMRIPEEVNRKLTDHIAALLFSATHHCINNLIDENIQDHRLRFTGDVLLDLFEKYFPSVHSGGEKIILLTLHRPLNTDNFQRLSKILEQINRLTTNNHVVFPIHPRTVNIYREAKLRLPGKIDYQAPLSYLETLQHLKSATLVITDSGGLQKEAYFARVPCLVLDTPALWPEIIEVGWQKLVTPENVYELASTPWHPENNDRGIFGDGHAAEKIAKHVKGYRC